MYLISSWVMSDFMSDFFYEWLNQHIQCQTKCYLNRLLKTSSNCWFARKPNKFSIRLLNIFNSFFYVTQNMFSSPWNYLLTIQTSATLIPFT